MEWFTNDFLFLREVVHTVQTMSTVSAIIISQLLVPSMGAHTYNALSEGGREIS